MVNVHLVGTDAWRFSAASETPLYPLSTMAPVLPPPREVVFQPTNNHDPGVKDVEVNTQVTPAIGGVADSVLDDLFNAWRCGSCTYQNLGKAIGACTMCNNPHPIQTPLSLDPWEIGELKARASVMVPTIPSIFADSPPDNEMPSECMSRQFCCSKSNETADFTL